MVKITSDYLLGKYLVAVAERNALEEGTLTAEETAGYWIHWAFPNVRKEFNYMLKENDILLSQNHFYCEVNRFLRECGH